MKGTHFWKLLFATALSVCIILAGCARESTQGTDVTDTPPQELPSESANQDDLPDPRDAVESDSVTILLAAAASLEYSFRDELIPLFQEQYSWITVEGTYDSSGKLQTQIEEGLEADVFMSAAMKQMNELVEQDLVLADSVEELLENRIVLIAPSDSDTEIASFADITQADTIALGDPESVPVGQYSREALTSLGIYDEVAAKTSFGTNVTEVLNWVGEGSADMGIVYATDAATTDRVKILAEAPEDSLANKVIYPVGIVASTANEEAAALFLEFLRSDAAITVFEDYGFSRR